jgi:hypothetical protein
MKQLVQSGRLILQADALADRTRGRRGWS